MDSLTSDLPGVEVYLDDILVSRASADEHLQNLKRLLQRLHEKSLCCRLQKCQFAQTKLEGVFGPRSLSQNGIERKVVRSVMSYWCHRTRCFFFSFVSWLCAV